MLRPEPYVIKPGAMPMMPVLHRWPVPPAGTTKAFILLAIPVVTVPWPVVAAPPLGVFYQESDPWTAPPVRETPARSAPAAAMPRARSEDVSHPAADQAPAGQPPPVLTRRGTILRPRSRSRNVHRTRRIEFRRPFASAKRSSTKSMTVGRPPSIPRRGKSPGRRRRPMIRPPVNGETTRPRPKPAIPTLTSP